MRNPVTGLTKKGLVWLDRFKDWSEALGPVLLVTGTLSSFQGLYYMSRGLLDPPPSSEHPVEMWWSMSWWGSIWLVVGVVAVISSIRPRQPAAGMAVGGVVFLHTLWGLSYLGEVLVEGPDRGWFLVLQHLAITALVLWANWIVGRRLRVRELVVE